jgi:hypothetical protein
MAPTQGGFIHLLKRLDKEVLRPALVSEDADAEEPLPLEGRKLHVHVDWDGR